MTRLIKVKRGSFFLLGSPFQGTWDLIKALSFASRALNVVMLLPLAYSVHTIKVHEWPLCKLKERGLTAWWAPFEIFYETQTAQAEHIQCLIKHRSLQRYTYTALLNAAYMFSAHSHQVPWLQGWNNLFSSIEPLLMTFMAKHWKDFRHCLL